MDLKVGDVVHWAKAGDGLCYEPGPYVVIQVYRDSWNGSVQVQHLDGRTLHFHYKGDPPGTFPQEHHDINVSRLRLDEFLTAAHRALHAKI